MSELPANTVRVFRWGGLQDRNNFPAWLRDSMQKGQSRFGTTGAPGVSLVIPTAQDLLQCAPGDYVTCDASGRLGYVTRTEFERCFEFAGQEPEPVHDISLILRDMVNARAADGGLGVITLEMVKERVGKAQAPLSDVYRRRVPELAA